MPDRNQQLKILATVYKKNGATLILLASWTDENTDVQLIIDWAKLGINSSKASITASVKKNSTGKKDCDW